MTERGQRLKRQGRGKRELKRKQRKTEIKQLTDTAERNEGVKEKRVSLLAAQLRLRKIEMRERESQSRREREQHKPSV